MGNTLVFVDAAFFSILSKHFGDGKYLKVDIAGFARKLAGKHNLFCKHIFYYTAPPFLSESPSSEEIKRKEGYDRFIGAVGKDKGITVEEGRCQKIMNSSGNFEYHQKGVDSLMVFDMASVPIKFPGVRKIIMVTSDTDFCPIVEKIESLGVDVLLCTYYERKRSGRFSVSHHLIDCCKSVYFLSRDDFENARLVKNEK